MKALRRSTQTLGLAVFEDFHRDVLRPHLVGVQNHHPDAEPVVLDNQKNSGRNLGPPIAHDEPTALGLTDVIKDRGIDDVVEPAIHVMVPRLGRTQ